MNNIRYLIQNTVTYKKLDRVKQIVTFKKANIDYLKENFVIAKTIGFDKWLEQCNTNNGNKGIVKDLIEKHTSI